MLKEKLVDKTLDKAIEMVYSAMLTNGVSFILLIYEIARNL
jgi:hypothetical protein